jgi:hypothetical protein
LPRGFILWSTQVVAHPLCTEVPGQSSLPAGNVCRYQALADVETCCVPGERNYVCLIILHGNWTFTGTSHGHVRRKFYVMQGRQLKMDLPQALCIGPAIIGLARREVAAILRSATLSLTFVRRKPNIANEEVDHDSLWAHMNCPGCLKRRLQRPV